MKSLSLIDSGEWTTPDCRVSQPRSYPVIRQLITEGKVELTNMFYIGSPSKTPPSALLKHNAIDMEDMEEKVNKDRRAVERQRVKFTAAKFGVPLKDIKDIKDFKEIEADFIILSSRPSDDRNDVIQEVLDQTQAHIVVTPYFSDASEIKKLLEISPNADERVVPYLPYRFSQGVIDTTKFMMRDGLEEIVSGQLCVVAGPLSSKTLLEFSMPCLDVLVQFLGAVDPFLGAVNPLNVSFSEPEALPVISATARHDNGVSSLLLSCAGGNFQHTDHYKILFLTAAQARFELDRSLTRCFYYRSTDQVSREFSHDVISAEINGSRPLLNEFFGLSQLNPSIIPLPCLSNFIPTQVLVDQLLQAVDLQQAGSFSFTY